MSVYIIYAGSDTLETRWQRLFRQTGTGTSRGLAETNKFYTNQTLYYTIPLYTNQLQTPVILSLMFSVFFFGFKNRRACRDNACLRTHYFCGTDHLPP